MSLNINGTDLSTELYDIDGSPKWAKLPEIDKKFTAPNKDFVQYETEDPAKLTMDDTYQDMSPHQYAEYDDPREEMNQPGHALSPGPMYDLSDINPYQNEKMANNSMELAANKTMTDSQVDSLITNKKPAWDATGGGAGKVKAGAAIGQMVAAGIHAADGTEKIDAPDYAANILGGAATGAAMGTTFGPVGTVVGAVGGAGVGTEKTIGQANKQKKQAGLRRGVEDQRIAAMSKYLVQKNFT